MGINRRDTLALGAGAAASALLWSEELLAQLDIKNVTGPDYKPERGASLRVMRPSRFVSPDQEIWDANTKKFSEKFGVAVRTDYEGWEDIRPKMAVSASIGAGPDVVVGWYDDPHLYPEKVLDLTDIATYLGQKYGGWYPALVHYAKRGDRWIGLPLGVGGGTLNYRKSGLQKAGFERMPNDFDGLLKVFQGYQRIGMPGGLTLGNAVGDGNTWHWILWGFGASVVDEKSQVILDSPKTVAALEYAQALFATFIPGTLSWLDPNNNKVFLSGECGITHNGISIYYAAKSSKDPSLLAIAEDMDHAIPPVGPSGKPTATGSAVTAFAFKHTRYPNAAKAYLTFMMEAEQYAPWQTGCIGYWQPSTRAYEKLPFWTADPKVTPFRDLPANLQYYGSRGSLGYASAAVLADYVVLDMFAQVCSGKRTPKDAAKEAARRAERYYKDRA